MALGKLFGAALVVGAGAAVANGLSVDGSGGFNLSVLGHPIFGECAKTIDQYKDAPPVNNFEKLEAIKQLGRACGFCDTKTKITTEIEAEVKEYRICMDPDTIQQSGETANGTGLRVKGYLETVPESGQGLVLNTFIDNPAICSASIQEVHNRSTKYIGEALGEAALAGIEFVVLVSPVRSLSCEAVA